MARGLVLALAMFGGIGAAMVLERFGVGNLLLKAAAFSVAFVLVFGGYSWTRRPRASR